MSHTPGPWRLAKIHKDDGIYGSKGEAFVVTEDGDQLCVIRATRSLAKSEQAHFMADPTRDANAHLISAAPDLLAAAKEASDWLYACGDGKELAAQLRAAISKAEGKS